MRLLKLRIGILLGNSLKVFYEDDDDSNPILITDISFDKDNEKGVEFIKLIKKENYSFEIFQKYYAEKIAIIKKQKNDENYINLSITKSKQLKKTVECKGSLIQRNNEKELLKSHKGIRKRKDGRFEWRKTVLGTQHSLIKPDLNELILMVKKYEKNLSKAISKLSKKSFQQYKEFLSNSFKDKFVIDDRDIE